MITNNVIPKKWLACVSGEIFTHLYFSYYRNTTLIMKKIDEAKKEIELVVTDFYYAYMEMRNEKWKKYSMYF